jgi:hypothetical protein
MDFRVVVCAVIVVPTSVDRRRAVVYILNPTDAPDNLNLCSVVVSTVRVKLRAD